ncbi:MAG TPA: hypothetical protein VFH27_18195, partial [Longimicrobiaceae bacterium]|nr:hypothetical protein [Longimicrobiaceae bacterium]
MSPFDDTIAAVATAPGRGAIALVRVSGPDALPLVRMLAPALPGDAAPRTQRLAAL